MVKESTPRILLNPVYSYGVVLAPKVVNPHQGQNRTPPGAIGRDSSKKIKYVTTKYVQLSSQLQPRFGPIGCSAHSPVCQANRLPFNLDKQTSGDTEGAGIWGDSFDLSNSAKVHLGGILVSLVPPCIPASWFPD